MQAGNFSGTFDQLFLGIFYAVFTEYASPLLLYHGAKKLKNDQSQIESVAIAAQSTHCRLGGYLSHGSSSYS